MKKKNKYQNGGMLLELMLSIALAAIVIPFVFRYQKNTIERARNISLVKQMETVQSALERCIFENREELLRQGVSIFSENNTDPDNIDCLILFNDDEDDPRGLINYGLTAEFVNDFRNDYVLRILKSNDNTGQPVLQGVVLLNNQNINALRTREIVRLGGGKVGFLDGGVVQGGYRAFNAEKIDFDFQNIDNGIVQTTDTMRGYSKYLWRLPSGDEKDATMLSWLNLDGHDINNVDALRAYNAIFSSDLVFPGDDSAVNATTVFFTKLASINSECNGDLATVRGHLTINSGGVLNVTDKTSLRGLGKFTECNSPKLNTHEMTLTKFSINSDSLTVGGRMVMNKIIAGKVSVDKGPVITPRLVISKRITSPDGKFYWEVDGKSKNEAYFNDAILTGVGYEQSALVPMLTEFVAGDEREFNGFAGGDLANDKFHLYSRDYFWNAKKNVLKVETVGGMLTELAGAQNLIKRKYSLISACSAGKYNDDIYFKNFCVNGGISYVCAAYTEDGVHCKDANDPRLHQFLRVINDCASLYPDDGKGSTSNQSGYDIYDGGTINPNPSPVVQQFALCLGCTEYVGQTNGLDYINACVWCANQKAVNTVTELKNCVDDYIAHPK